MLLRFFSLIDMGFCRIYFSNNIETSSSFKFLIYILTCRFTESLIIYSRSHALATLSQKQKVINLFHAKYIPFVAHDLLLVLNHPAVSHAWSCIQISEWPCITIWESQIGRCSWSCM